MISRRAFQLLVPATLLELSSSSLALAASAKELFTLARNKNANVVKYAVRTTKDGRLLADRPIEAFWQMLAENGRREELTWAERQLAYGFGVSDVVSDGCRLTLSACSQRVVHVTRVEGAFVARLAVAGKPATLQRIFVQADEGALLPSVRYVELSGLIANGQRVAERIEAQRSRRVSRF